jgi:hypothetical protein
MHITKHRVEEIKRFLQKHAVPIPRCPFSSRERKGEETLNIVAAAAY